MSLCLMPRVCPKSYSSCVKLVIRRIIGFAYFVLLASIFGFLGGSGSPVSPLIPGLYESVCSLFSLLFTPIPMCPRVI